MEADIAVHKSPPIDWDDWLHKKRPLGGFLQSISWAKVNFQVNGARPFFLEARVAGERAACLQVWGPDDSFPKRLRRINRGLRGRNVLMGLDGPTIGDSAFLPVLDPLIRAAVALADDLHLEKLIVQTPVSPTILVEPSALRSYFQGSGFAEKRTLTSLVDLQKDDEGITRTYSRSARKSIRKAEKLRVTAKRCLTSDEFESLFLRTYVTASGLRGNGQRKLRKRLMKGWEFDPDGATYRYFVALDADGAPLATLGTSSFAGLATEIASSLLPRARREGIPAQDVLHDHILRFHRTAGDSMFDMAGYEENPSTSKEVGIRRFKEKWGGMTYAVSTFSRPCAGWSD